MDVKQEIKQIKTKSVSGVQEYNFSPKIERQISLSDVQNYHLKKLNASVAHEKSRKKRHQRYLHYENTPMQYTTIFHGGKNLNFQMKKKCYIFLIFTSRAKIRETIYPSKPQSCYIKVGV